MNSVKKIVLEKAIKQIEALELKYAIIDFDGNILGNLNVEKNKRPSKYGYGLLTQHIRGHVQNLAIGDVAAVPWENFEAEDLSLAIGKFAYNLWGKGNSTYLTIPKHRTVEVIRTG